MTIAIYSLMFAAIMILVTKIPVAIAMNKQAGGYDNRLPRDQQARLEGLGKRAVAAHQNTLEAFPLFAAGLLMALYFNKSGASTDTITYLCYAFIVSRIIYTAAYWADIHMLRSTAWSVGFIASLWLMVTAL